MIDNRGSAPHDAGAPAGERRLVTVLFADLVGYTAASELRDPELMRDALEICFGRLAGEIRRYGGYVDKVMGDAIMALFGAPRAQEDDAGKAVAAALAMQEAIEELAPEIERRLGARFFLRIGINTGLVVTGTVGPGTYTVTGDTVNVASRLESNAPHGAVLVGEATRRLARRQFRWGERRELAVKNRAEPVVCYVAEGVSTEVMRLVPAPSETPFVGRASDLARLGEVWSGATSERVVELVGEAGIGKTRFLSHFLSVKNVTAEQVVYTRADTPPRTFGPLLQLLPAISDSLPREARMRLLRLANTHDDEAETPGEAAPEWLVDGLVEVMSALSRSHTVALVLDDMHRADGATLEVVERLLPRLAEMRVVVFMLRQPRGWRPKTVPRADTIELHALDDEEALALVRSAAPDLDDVRARSVVAASGGNPLYLEVLAAAALRTPVGAEVPETLQTAIIARVDELDESSRQVLREASVFGHAFLEEPLKLVTTRKDELYGALADLCRAGLLDEMPVPNGRGYNFRHSLVQQVVHNGLLRRERQLLHLRAAEALELVRDEGVDVEPEQIGWHFEQAGDAQRAAAYHLVSADRADRLRAPAQAKHYRRAASRLLGLTSLADLYFAPRPPRWRDRLLAVAIQVILAAVVVLPTFIIFSVQRPEQQAITLGLPLEIMDVNASSVLVAVMIGGLPLLLAGVLFAHLAAPVLMRRRVSLTATVVAAASGWLLAASFVLVGSAALVVLLRYGFLDRVSSIYVGAATLQVLLGDRSLLVVVVVGTVAIAAVWTVLLRLQAVSWTRSSRAVVTPREHEEGRRWAALRQSSLLVALAGASALAVLLANALDVLPNTASADALHAPRTLVLLFGASAVTAIALLCVWVSQSRLSARAPNFRTGLLGFEVPLVCALAFGLVLWFGMRQAVIEAANNVDTPGHLPEFRRAVGLFPEFGMGYYMRGEQHLALADLDRNPPDQSVLDAIEDFTRAIELDPEFPAPYLARGRAYIAMRDYESAIEDAERLIELRPAHPAGYAIRAWARSAGGDLEGAFADVSAVVAPLPEGAHGWDAYFVRCLALTAVERYEEAAEECEQVILLNPDQIVALDQLGLIASRNGEYEEALAYTNRIVAVHPANYKAWTNRGSLNRLLENYEEAEQDLTRAIELQPDYVFAYQNRSITRLYLDRPEDAMADAHTAVRLSPQEQFTRLFIARYTGDLEQALEDASELIERSGPGSASLPYLLSARGLVRVQLGEVEAGLADLDEALRLDREQAALYDRRGHARYLAGDVAGATEDFDEALRRLPTLPPQGRAELHYHRALLLRDAGDIDGAEEELREAATLVRIPSFRRLIENAVRELAAEQPN